MNTITKEQSKRLHCDWWGQCRTCRHWNGKSNGDGSDTRGNEIRWQDVLGKTYSEELVEDMLTLMSSFSNKLYGKRSAEMKKQRKLAKLAAEKAIVEQKAITPDKENNVPIGV